MFGIAARRRGMFDIQCPVCNKPVERVEVSPFWGDRTITVWCHGETDQMVLTKEFLSVTSPSDFIRGQFVPFQKNLPVPQPARIEESHVE